MANELKTRFIYDDADNAKIIGTQNLLTKTNDFFNSLGKNADFGKKIGNESSKSAEALGKLGKEVESLKTKTETFAPRPTISRYWESEANKVDESVKKIEQAENSLSRRSGYRSVGFKIDDSTGGIVDSKASPATAAVNKPKINIDYGESKFNSAAAGIRNVGNEAEKAGEKMTFKTSVKLDSKIFNRGELKRALSNAVSKTAKEFKQSTKDKMRDSPHTGRVEKAAKRQRSRRGERPQIQSQKLLNAVSDKRTSDFSFTVFIDEQRASYGEILQDNLGRNIMTLEDAEEANKNLQNNGENALRQIL